MVWPGLGLSPAGGTTVHGPAPQVAPWSVWGHGPRGAQDCSQNGWELGLGTGEPTPGRWELGVLTKGLVLGPHLWCGSFPTWGLGIFPSIG